MYLLKVQHIYITFIGFHGWFLYVDFYSFSFMHLNAGPMALPTDDKQQCYPYVGQYVKVDTKVIPQYQIISLVLSF